MKTLYLWTETDDDDGYSVYMADEHPIDGHIGARKSVLLFRSKRLTIAATYKHTIYNMLLSAGANVMNMA